MIRFFPPGLTCKFFATKKSETIYYGGNTIKLIPLSALRTYHIHSKFQNHGKHKSEKDNTKK